MLRFYEAPEHRLSQRDTDSIDASVSGVNDRQDRRLQSW